ncbi:DUF6879 family protein [Sphaerisporangium sp. NPDC051017]|uniref:DUF6879 family protein n=1 Tax=Sphaerisporangium sp. NPDC051017 TaxID=3154636 RepID=UPI0034471CA0
MTQLVTGEDFLSLFTRFQHTAFRLELRDRYNVPAERERWEAFLSGDTAELERLNAEQRAAWMRMIGASTSAGKRVERVRVVTEPPPDYIRFELTLNAGNAEAGEDIRYLPRDQAAELDLPGVDYWLFDSRFAVVLPFDDDDVLLDMELMDDPASVVALNAARDAAWHHAIPYPIYAEKWTGGAQRTPGA